MTKSPHTERGQALVLMVFALIGLLAIAGLAIDGGMVYLERRRMQNAADSASLAGTRLLASAICDPSAANDAAIAEEVRHYAEINGVENPDNTLLAVYVDKDQRILSPVGGGTIPTGATGISATVGITRPTYFIGLVGIDEGKASAQAVAMTGPVAQLNGGVLPIAVPLDVVQALGPDETFSVIETNQHNGGSFCREDDGTCIGDPTSANAQRGWLNLNYIYNTAFLAQSDPLYRTFEQIVSNRPCGSNPSISADDGLQGWASGNCPYPYPFFTGTVGGTNGDFIHGDSGARQSSLAEISYLEGQIGYVPVFDYIYLSDYMADHFPQPEGIGWPRAGGGGHAFLYHIVGFAAIRVDNISGHTLVGEFQNALIGEAQFLASSGFGTGACSSTELYGISLWQ